MKLDIESLIIKNKKNRKLHIILTSILGVFLITSLLLFILLSNYQIEVLMSILGSIVTSLISLLIVGEIIFGILKNHHEIHFYEMLLSYKETKLKVKNIKLSENRITSFKFVSLKYFEYNNDNYYILEDVLESILENESTLILRGNYVVGVDDEK